MEEFKGSDKKYENSENVIEKRRKKLSNFLFSWIKDDYDKAFLLIFIGFLLMRIYYFWMTRNQPLWWDEADYMGIAKTWAGIMDYPVNVIRPLLLPIIAYFFELTGAGEMGMRLLLVILSLSTIFLMYTLASFLFNKKVGIISSFLLGIYWSFTFFSFRVLVDVPLTFLWLASIFTFFYSYFNNKSWKYFVLAGIILGASFLMKFTSAALVIIFAVYLLTTEKIKVIKNKKIWAFYIASFFTVLPFFIYQHFSYGDFFAFNKVATANLVNVKLLPSFIGHFALSSSWLLSIGRWLFFLGFLWMLIDLVIGFDFISKKRSKQNKEFFVIIWIVISIFLFARIFDATGAEDRYYFIFNPAMFLVIALVLENISKCLKGYSKILPAIFLIGILLFVGYQNTLQTDQVIKSRLDSFGELKKAGEWINRNTPKSDSILVAEESAEIIYYAERAYNIENHNLANKTDLINKINLHNPSHIVLSFYYYLQRNNGGSLEVLQYIFSRPEAFQVVQTYGPYVDKEQTLPLVVIVKVNRDKLDI
jgi:hypothetical protein